MRTTITLEDDLAAELDRYQHAQRTTFKAALHDVLRRGLATLPPRDAAPPFVVEPHASGLAAGVDPDRLHALLDELDVDVARRRVARS